MGALSAPPLPAPTNMSLTPCKSGQQIKKATVCQATDKASRSAYDDIRNQDSDTLSPDTPSKLLSTKSSKGLFDEAMTFAF
jgi:hypothetical protein